MEHKMAGLPHIDLATELLSQATKSNEVPVTRSATDTRAKFTRRLQVTDVEGTGTDSTVTTITASETNTNVRGNMYITKGNYSVKSNLSEAQDFYENKYNCSIKGIPAKLNEPSDISEPLSIYELLTVENRDSLIVWPSPSDSVTIHEFAVSPIIDRSDLNKAIDGHIINSNETGVYYWNKTSNSNSVRRLGLTDMTTSSEIPEDEQYMYKEEFFPPSLKEMAVKYRLDYTDLQNQFRANYKNLVPRHKTSQTNSNPNRILLADTNGSEPTDLHKKIDALKNHMSSLSAMINDYHSATHKFKNERDHRGLIAASQTTREKLKVLLGKYLDEKDSEGNSRRSKLKEKVMDEAEVNAAGLIDFINQQAMTTFMSTVSNSKKFAYTRGNPSMACRAASSSLETFYDLMDTLIFSILSGLSDDLGQVIEFMGYPGQVGDITGGLLTLDTLLQVLMPALKMIPYVGGLFNTFGTMYHNAMPPVKDVDKPVGGKFLRCLVTYISKCICKVDI